MGTPRRRVVVPIVSDYPGGAGSSEIDRLDGEVALLALRHDVAVLV